MRGGDIIKKILIIAKIVIVPCGILLLLSWLFIYNYDYINIPTTVINTKSYDIFLAFTFILPIILFVIGVIIIIKEKSNKKSRLIKSILIILVINLLVFAYNRNETIYYTQSYISQKQKVNENYYLYSSDGTKFRCPKKIYITIIPEKEYILTFRSNKLLHYYKKIVDSTEIEKY
ncbi:hypothetical protein acsn021_35520 [Anaerocolumna cellulosilytica]|uniref:Uncharacterized protein n=1 Tax=Anaerocolumna cellulosilytica TaxID=433286 RepID=A0A6S6QXP9_9FIRM|nr:cytochrome c biogenesis factor [Anaerocolumna cellulosilytica]BCJ95983.1 hypothetical protein acsn021_35520 [Anaerocolumna cellulosilytica]